MAAAAVLPPTQLLVTLIKGEDLANVEIGKEDPSVLVTVAYGPDMDPEEDGIIASVQGETHNRGGRNPDFEGEVLTVDLPESAEPGQQIWLKLVVADINGRRDKPMGHGFVEISRLDPNVVVPMQVALTLGQDRAGVLEFTVVKRCPLAPTNPPPQFQQAPPMQPMMMVHGGTGVPPTAAPGMPGGMPPRGGGYFPGQPAPSGGAPPMGYPGGPPIPTYQQPAYQQPPPPVEDDGADEAELEAHRAAMEAQRAEMEAMKAQMEAMRAEQEAMARAAFEARQAAIRAAEEAEEAEEEEERQRLAEEAAARREAAAAAEEAAREKAGGEEAVAAMCNSMAVGGPPLDQCACAAIFRRDAAVRWGPRGGVQKSWLQQRHLYGILFGRRFVQIGTFRLGMYAGRFVVVHGGSRGSPETAKVIMYCTPDGQPHFDGSDFEEGKDIWSRPITRVTDGVSFGNRAIRVGFWVIGTHDGTHLAIGNLRSHKTALILKKDGTVHPGPRDNWPEQNEWNLDQPWSEGGTEIAIGDNNLDLGEFRIGTDRPDRLLFSFVGEEPKCMVEALADGTVNRSAEHADEAIAADEHIPNAASGVTFVPCGINFGKFRIGRGQSRLTFGVERGGEFHAIWAAKDDGECVTGGGEAPWLSAMEQRNGRETFPRVGDGFLDIGQFRIGDYRNRLVIASTKTHRTLAIFRQDGQHFEGPFEEGSPRDEFFRPFHERPFEGSTASVKFGQGFIQLGNWRIGLQNEARFAITYNGQAEDE